MPRLTVTDNLSAMPPDVGHTRVWSLGGDYSYADASGPNSSVKARLFAQISRLYMHVLLNQPIPGGQTRPLFGHYPSDLFHDAIQVNGWSFAPGQRFGFQVDADPWGTWLWTPSPDGSFPDSHRQVRFACGVWAEETPFEHHPWYMSATCSRWER